MALRVLKKLLTRSDVIRVKKRVRWHSCSACGSSVPHAHRANSKSSVVTSFSSTSPTSSSSSTSSSSPIPAATPFFSPFTKKSSAALSSSASSKSSKLFKSPLLSAITGASSSSSSSSSDSSSTPTSSSTSTSTSTSPVTASSSTSALVATGQKQNGNGTNSSSEAKKNFLSEILFGNRSWLDQNQQLFAMNVDAVLETQKPFSTLLTCCDSRVPLTVLGVDNPGKIFSVRNIGNQIRNSEGSFRYGIEVLKTPFAMILGHTHCGAVRGAASDYRSQHTQVQREILSLVRVIRFCESLVGEYDMDNLSWDQRCNIYSEVNIDYQVNRLINDWQIRRRVRNGELTIVGLMFDMHNVYGNGHGRVNIVNINGDHDELSMKQNSLLKEFRKEIMPVKRLFSYPSRGNRGYDVEN